MPVNAGFYGARDKGQTKAVVTGSYETTNIYIYIWVLGTKLRLFARTVSTLNDKLSLQPLKLLLFF
jgi:hypothetical protein